MDEGVRIFDYLILIFILIKRMVIKTELCAFSEWKIYPGRGIRFVAKDGRPFLFLSKRTKDFSLRYTKNNSENSRPRDSDGPQLGEDSTRNSSKLTSAKTKRRKSSENRELLKESLLMISKKSRVLALKTKRPLLKKLFVRSNKERKPLLPRRVLQPRTPQRIRMFSKKLKIKLPKKFKRKLSPRRNDALLI
jgi:ribosomal protein L24E